jgi:hypothetical protein
MRELAGCISFVSDSYDKAHLALAEVTTFLMAEEGGDALSRATVISVDLAMDDRALYYCNVVIER